MKVYFTEVPGINVYTCNTQRIVVAHERGLVDGAAFVHCVHPRHDNGVASGHDPYGCRPRPRLLHTEGGRLKPSVPQQRSWRDVFAISKSNQVDIQNTTSREEVFFTYSPHQIPSPVTTNTFFNGRGRVGESNEDYAPYHSLQTGAGMLNPPTKN